MFIKLDLGNILSIESQKDCNHEITVEIILYSLIFISFYNKYYLCVCSEADIFLKLLNLFTDF